MKSKPQSDIDGWFQMVSSRSKCWPSIISLALTAAEKLISTQKLNLKVFKPCSGYISEIFLIGSLKSYLYFTFEPKSPSAPDMHADANADAHADAMCIE